MTKFNEITVTDSLGETFPLTDCTILCAKVGPFDYSEPTMIIYPDGETVLPLWDVPEFTDAKGRTVPLDEIIWDGDAP